MAQEHAADDFDWVTAQSACNSTSMFAWLQAGAKRDVERRNGLAGRDDGWTFELHEEDDRFEVSRVVTGFTGSKVLAVVSFERQGRRILVHGDGIDVEITAVVALDVAGTCRLVIAEAGYSEWEFRKLALEQLFFAEAEDD